MTYINNHIKKALKSSAKVVEIIKMEQNQR